MKIKKIHYRVPVDEISDVHVYVSQPDLSKQNTLFIFSHGFSVDGTESFRLFIKLSNKLVELGYPTILFDYRGNGYSDLEFEDMTFDTLLADLNAITAFASEKFPGYQIAYWGMSFGCAIATSVASVRTDINLMVLWGLSADIYQRYRDTLLDREEIDEKGYTYISKGFKVKREFLESLQGRDIYAAIRDASIPTLLVHGTDDATASIELARTAHRLAPDNTTLYEVIGGNHGFKVQPERYEEAVKASLFWVAKMLDEPN